jgi:hypothetical protein
VFAVLSTSTAVIDAARRSQSGNLPAHTGDRLRGPSASSPRIWPVRADLTPFRQLPLWRTASVEVEAGTTVIDTVRSPGVIAKANVVPQHLEIHAAHSTTKLTSWAKDFSKTGPTVKVGQRSQTGLTRTALEVVGTGSHPSRIGKN